jgi:hypothetical protein
MISVPSSSTERRRRVARVRLAELVALRRAARSSSMPQHTDATAAAPARAEPDAAE